MRCCSRSSRTRASAPRSLRRRRHRLAAAAAAVLLGLAAGPGRAAAQPASPRSAVIRAYEGGAYQRVVDFCTAQLAAAHTPDERAFYTYYLAAAHHRLAQPARALTLWTRVREEAPDSALAVRAVLGIALAHASLGEWPECERAAAQFLGLLPEGSDAVVARYWLGEALAHQGRWADAARQFQALLDRSETHALQIDGRVALIQCLAELGDVAAAQGHVQRLAELAPTHPELGRSWLRVAQAARNAGDPRRAVAAAETARRTDPALRLDATLIIGEAALVLDDPARAEETLSPLLAETGPAAERARLMLDLAWTAFLQRRDTRVVALAGQAATLSPAALGPQDTLRLGLSYVALGAGDDAGDVLAPLQGEPALAPVADPLNAVLAVATFGAGDLVAARRLLLTALREWPDSPRTAWRHELLGRIAAAQGRWRGAAEAYEAAAERTAGERAASLQWLVADANARAGRWPAARTILWNLQPVALPAAYRPLRDALLADAGAQAGEWTTAAEAYARAARLAGHDQDSGRYARRAARAAVAGGDRALLERLAADIPPTEGTAEVWTWLAVLAERAGDAEAARAARMKIAGLPGADAAHARLHLAWDSLDRGRPDPAVEYLTAGSPPELAPWVQYGLALAHLRQGSYRVAAAEFGVVADRFADTPVGRDAALRVGQALNAAGAWREAESAYAAAAERLADPDARRQAQFGIGWTLARQGLDEAAGEAFAAALAARDDDGDAARALMWLAQRAFDAGRYDRAAEALARAAAADIAPEDKGLAEYWLGRTLMRQEQFVAAAATFAACLQHWAGTAGAPLVRFWEIRCAEALGDDAAVLANVRDLRERYPRTADWLELDAALARAHERRGEWAEALAAYDVVAGRDAGALGAEATIAGARCLEELGDRDGAIVRLFRIRPGEQPEETVARARLLLATMLLRAGRAPDAWQVLTDLTRTFPDTEAGRTAAARLTELGDSAG